MEKLIVNGTDLSLPVKFANPMSEFESKATYTITQYNPDNNTVFILWNEDPMPIKGTQRVRLNDLINA